MLDQSLLLEPLERPDHPRVLLRLFDGVIAEVELEDVVVADTRVLQAPLDELVVLFLVDPAAHVVPAHAVHDALEIIRLPRQALDGRRHRVGGPRVCLVPVVDPGLHRPGDQLLRPVGRTHEPADLKAGAAVSPHRHFVGGGRVIRQHGQSGDARRGHAGRPEPHHPPARKVLRVVTHGRIPLVLAFRLEKQPGSREIFSLQDNRRRSTTTHPRGYSINSRNAQVE